MIPLPLLPRWLRITTAVLVAGIIFYGSLITVPETAIDEVQPELIQLSYWRHILAYSALAGSLAYATDHWTLPRWRHAALVIVIATVYGIAMELGQALLPHRTPFLLTDVVVNALGASVAVIWFLSRPYLDLRPVSEFLPVANDTSDRQC